MAEPIRPAPAEPAHNGIPRENRLTLIGIMLGLFLAALDQTIVSTALPKIIADLNGTELYAWVTTAYLLASTVSAPIFGRLTELFSRKSILLIAILIFLGGSALCGLSQNMPELIIFRGIQGIGGGALFALALTTIAVLFPPRERGRVGGLFGAVFGVSSAVGPWLGGLLTDHLSWHWVFYINMPVGAVALWFIGRFMPRLRPDHRESFDFLGAALLIAWTVPLMLAFSWGGSTYPWGSPRILGLFALSAVALALWVWSQNREKHPLFDLSILKIRTFSIASIAVFFYGPAFLGAVAFLPLYLQVVKGVSASASGVTVLPMTLGVVLGATGSGILSGRLGRYKPLLIIGTLWLLAVFLTLHFVLSVNTPLWLAIVFFFLLGLGLGPSQSLLQIAAQNNIPPQRLGSATAATQLIRQIGSTIGIALLGTVLTQNLNAETCKVFPDNASCKPGALMQRNNEGGTGANLDEQFQKLEAQIVAALKGDEAAYEELLANKDLPEDVKGKLVRGGLPAQFKDIEAKVIAALKGDERAYAELVNDPNVPTELKSKLVKGGIPAQFQKLEAQVTAALKGDERAYAELVNDPNVPTELKSKLVKGGIPAQFQKLEAQVTAALKGDERAYAELVNDPNVPAELKSKLVKGGIPAQFKELGDQVEAALRGDIAAYNALMRNPQVPAELKSRLIKGGIPAQFQALEAQVEAALRGDEAAYTALIRNPQVPAELKSRLVKGGIPAQFKELEGLLIAALNGDPQAYQAVQNNPQIPARFKGQIPQGGIAAQVQAQLAQTESLLEAALQGDAQAAQALRATPNLDPRIQALLDNPPPPEARPAALAQVKAGLEAQLPQIVAAATQQATSGIKAGLQQAQAEALAQAIAGVKAGLAQAQSQAIAAAVAAVRENLRQAQAQATEAAIAAVRKNLQAAQTSATEQAVRAVRENLRQAQAQATEQAVRAVVENLRQAQATAEEKAIRAVRENLATAEQKALVEVPQTVVANLEQTKAKLHNALNNGITNAEKNIFLYAAAFVLISLVFIGLLPNDELRGGGGFGARGGQAGPPVAAH
ncbi:DHA2 family efflux MFS transporter permease subunit [Meiothermus sp. PNK-Is4]|uniref:MDR family MFS transporter n=1 Tax=Meiothermus sp. PNK-Is4 TaxID=2740565 RepID=UPI00101FD986|nr:MDR family MFS transporter [Meiothermus sp. PNK-Is4]RYM33163.1 DHA2 family efflux MFS transporter permease subunit [Meiothermus sp. PNK-Is4]